MKITLTTDHMTPQQLRWWRHFRGRSIIKPGSRVIAICEHGVGAARVIDWRASKGRKIYLVQPEDESWPARCWVAIDGIVPDWWPAGTPGQVITD